MSPIGLALLACVVYCTSVNATESELVMKKSMGLTKAEEDSGQDLACTPFIKYSNGTDMPVTIGQYLENAESLPCHGEVNRDLIMCFTGGSEVSPGLRERLKSSLGNVCGMFVELFSLLARSGHGVDICNNTALTDATLTGDFCQEVVAESPDVTATMTTLDALGYPRYSSVVTKLLNLGDECPQTCGLNGGNILCNAYFSLASVLSIVALEPTQPQNAPEPIAAYSEPVPISTLLLPMRSLPLTTLQTLLFSSPQHMQKVLSSALVEELSSADLQTFQQRPDLVTIVRMFWVVDCVYDRLNAMNSSYLEFSTRHDNLPFQGGMGQEDKEILKDFEDKDTIFKYIYEYRTWLFNVPTPIGGDGVTPPSPPISSTPSISPPTPSPPSPTPPPSPRSPASSNKPLDTEQLKLLQDLGNDPSLPKLLRIFSEEDDTLSKDDIVSEDIVAFKKELLSALGVDAEELKVKLLDPKIQVALGISNGLEDDGAEENRGDATDSRNKELEQAVGGAKDSGNKELEQAVGGAKDSGNKELEQAVGDAKGIEEPSSSGYGAFHFLGLFLVIAVASVVGYLCMHNRKKLREGVNGYISSSGKRRRTRNYKPLATAET